MTSPADADACWLYRAGSISALALGAGYVVIIALYIPMGVPPHGVEARLAYVAAHATAWQAILGLSVLTDFLFAPVTAALYVALRRAGGAAMALAAACIALFVVLDLAITWTNYAALIQLSHKYTSAADVAQKAAAIAAADYPSTILESTLLFVYNTLTLAVGILITGLVMRKAGFSKSAAYLGIATGILGVISVAGPLLISALSATIIATSVLTTAWLFVVGGKLFALGRR
jgi:hypothetical protein